VRPHHVCATGQARRSYLGAGALAGGDVGRDSSAAVWLRHGNISIGRITPPLGVCLFADRSLSRISIACLVRVIMP